MIPTLVQAQQIIGGRSRRARLLWSTPYATLVYLILLNYQRKAKADTFTQFHLCDDEFTNPSLCLIEHHTMRICGGIEV
jgi:hypothetical protein